MCRLHFSASSMQSKSSSTYNPQSTTSTISALPPRPLHFLHTRHLHKHNQAGRKEKPGHGDVGQEVDVDSEREVDDRSQVNGRKSQLDDEHATGDIEGVSTAASGR